MVKSTEIEYMYRERRKSSNLDILWQALKLTKELDLQAQMLVKLAPGGNPCEPGPSTSSQIYA